MCVFVYSSYHLNNVRMNAGQVISPPTKVTSAHKLKNEEYTSFGGELVGGEIPWWRGDRNLSFLQLVVILTLETLKNTCIHSENKMSTASVAQMSNDKMRFNNNPTFLEWIYPDFHQRNRFLDHDIACNWAHPRAIRCSRCRHVSQQQRI